MSDILFVCPSCRQDLVVDATGAGLTIACPRCERPVKIPAKADTGVIRVPEAEALRSRLKDLENDAAAERRRAEAAEKTLEAATVEYERRQSEAGRAAEAAVLDARRRLTDLEQSLSAEREKTRALVQKEQMTLEALQRARQEMDEAARQTDFLRHEMERLQDDGARAQQELAQRISSVDRLERQLRASDSEREELALAASRSQHDSALLQRNRDLAAHRDRLTVELAEARGALLRTETQLYHAWSAREGLTAMVGNLRANLHATSELYHSMASTVDTLELEVQRLQRELRESGCEAA